MVAVELVGLDGSDDGNLVPGLDLIRPGRGGNQFDDALTGGEHEQPPGAVVGVPVDGQVGDDGAGGGQLLPFLSEPLVGDRLSAGGQFEGAVQPLIGGNGRAEQPQLARSDGGGPQRAVRFAS